MFAVIYRGSVYPELEQEYIALWSQITEYFMTHRGAIGSCLHKTDEGEYIAYSRWPDKATRDKSWGAEADVNEPEIALVIERFKKCIDRSEPFDEICMDVVQDLLTVEKT